MHCVSGRLSPNLGALPEFSRRFRNDAHSVIQWVRRRYRGTARDSGDRRSGAGPALTARGTRRRRERRRPARQDGPRRRGRAERAGRARCAEAGARPRGPPRRVRAVRRWSSPGARRDHHRETGRRTPVRLGGRAEQTRRPADRRPPERGPTRNATRTSVDDLDLNGSTGPGATTALGSSDSGDATVPDPARRRSQTTAPPRGPKWAPPPAPSARTPARVDGDPRSRRTE